MKRREQRRVRAVIGQTRRDENVGRETADDRRAVALVRVLIRDEEECLVLFDRAAEGPAKDISPEDGPRYARCLQERVVGVESIVAEIIVDRPVEFVAAALGQDLQVAAARAPEGGVVERSLDLKLLDRFRGRDGQRGCGVGADGVSVDAVDLVVVVRHATAVDGNVLRPASHRCVVRQISRGARRQTQQLREVARPQWQLRDSARADDPTKLRSVVLHQRSGISNNDGGSGYVTDL